MSDSGGGVGARSHDAPSALHTLLPSSLQLKRRKSAELGLFWSVAQSGSAAPHFVFAFFVVCVSLPPERGASLPPGAAAWTHETVAAVRAAVEVPFARPAGRRPGDARAVNRQHRARLACLDAPRAVVPIHLARGAAGGLARRIDGRRAGLVAGAVGQACHGAGARALEVDDHRALRAPVGLPHHGPLLLLLQRRRRRRGGRGERHGHVLDPAPVPALEGRVQLGLEVLGRDDGRRAARHDLDGGPLELSRRTPTALGTLELAGARLRGVRRDLQAAAGREDLRRRLSRLTAGAEVGLADGVSLPVPGERAGTRRRRDARPGPVTGWVSSRSPPLASTQVTATAERPCCH